MDNKSGEIRTPTYSGVFVRGLGIPPRFSPCKTHSGEMAQSSGFDPMLKVKTCFDARCLMSLIGLLASTEKMVPEVVKSRICDVGRRPSSQRPQYPNLYKCLKQSLCGLWSDRENRLHINVLELKVVSLALKRFKDQCQNQTVLVARTTQQ